MTIDAMGCQKDIAEEIVSLEADYLLARQSSNSSPNRTILQRHLMLILKDMRFAETYDHGCLESRRRWVGCS